MNRNFTLIHKFKVPIRSEVISTYLPLTAIALITKVRVEGLYTQFDPSFICNLSK